MTLKTQHIATEELCSLLSRASEQERQSLSAILRGADSEVLSPATLVHEVGLAGGHGIANLLRGGDGIGYLEILEDAVGELNLSTTHENSGGFPRKYSRRELEKIEHPPQDEDSKNLRRDLGLRTEPYSRLEIEELREEGNRYAEQCELSIINHVLKTAYSNFDKAQRVRFDHELAKIACSFSSDNDPSALTGAAGLMAIANLGGFATYTLMSSVLSMITFGTLGFGAYTAASALLSVAIGPVGWLALGSVAAYKFGKPELEKTIPFAATVGMLRQRIQACVVPEQERKRTQNSSPPPVNSPVQFDTETTKDSLVTDTYKATVGLIDEAYVVTKRLIDMTPKIVSDQRKKTNAEMDAIFKKLGL